MGPFSSTRIYLPFHFVQIHVCNDGAIAVEDLGQLLESRASSFHIEVVHKDKFNEDPNLFPSTLAYGTNNIPLLEIAYRVDQR